MSYRDSLEAAQARIAQLEAQVAELLEAAEKGELDRANLRADLAVQKMEAERRIAELAQEAHVEEVQAQELAATARLRLEAKIKSLEAQLQSAHQVITRLKSK